jgi:hypothetical protein
MDEGIKKFVEPQMALLALIAKKRTSSQPSMTSTK